MWVLPLPDVRYCWKLSQYAISQKTYDLKSRIWQKPRFRSDFGALSPNLDDQNFFKNLALSVTRYHSQLSSYTILWKTNNPILRKFNDRWTDGLTDRRTDESDFIGWCPTKVEGPTRAKQSMGNRMCIWQMKDALRRMNIIAVNEINEYFFY